MARWIILTLPTAIMSSIIHEPLHRQLFDDKEMKSLGCITRYPRSMQYYNTAILFFRFVGSATMNLFFALFITFGTVRQRDNEQH